MGTRLVAVAAPGLALLVAGRVTRGATLARTTLGVPLLFFRRERLPGRGEGNSGLQFDTAVTRVGGGPIIVGNR